MEASVARGSGKRLRTRGIWALFIDRSKYATNIDKGCEPSHCLTRLGTCAGSSIVSSSILLSSERCSV